MAGRHYVQPKVNCYGATGENQCVNQILFWVLFHGSKERGRPARNLGKLYFRREMAHYWEVSVKRASKP